MKLIAAIFFIVFSAFTGETLVMPLNCPDTQKVSSCSKCKKKTTISRCMGEEKGKSNPSKSSMPQCLVCPLCVLVIQTSANNFQTILHFTKTEYTLAQVRRLADYAQQQWKPPNPGSPFQLI